MQIFSHPLSAPLGLSPIVCHATPPSVSSQQLTIAYLLAHLSRLYSLYSLFATFAFFSTFSAEMLLRSSSAVAALRHTRASERAIVLLVAIRSK